MTGTGGEEVPDSVGSARPGADTDTDTDTDTNAAPGQISLNWKPWAVVSIDGQRADRPVLAAYPLAGGRHTIELVCPSLDGKRKEIVVDIDGQHEHLGCWNFREDRFGCD